MKQRCTLASQLEPSGITPAPSRVDQHHLTYTDHQKTFQTIPPITDCEQGHEPNNLRNESNSNQTAQIKLAVKLIASMSGVF